VKVSFANGVLIEGLHSLLRNIYHDYRMLLDLNNQSELVELHSSFMNGDFCSHLSFEWSIASATRGESRISGYMPSAASACGRCVRSAKRSVGYRIIKPRKVRILWFPEEMIPDLEVNTTIADIAKLAAILES
jgi:hypothetical protein